ncbi:MAG: hypothetical protein H0W15_04095 [Gemmatimonadales bacterium]|nr:hypothetical protein [Gemmatimonadales bacterium]
MRNVNAVVIVGLVLGCAASTASAPLGDEFTAAPDQPLRINGTEHRITLKAVRSDSRCPADVTCVWAGNAEVSFRVEAPGVDTTVMLNTGIEPRAAKVGAIRIELMAVSPVPRSDTPIAAKDYRATLVARRVP